MPKYKLVYFDIDGGRAEPIRIALHIGGIAFEDKRFSFEEFGEVRKSTRFNSVPVFEIDGAQITQTNALCRYIGKMVGLYPSDNLQALYCDEALGALEDMSQRIARTYGLPEDELKKAREELVEGWLTTFLRGIEQLLNRGGGEYFADNTLTVADLRCFVQMRSLESGILDHIPKDIVKQVAPALYEHQKRVEADPRVRAYYASRS